MMNELSEKLGYKPKIVLLSALVSSDPNYKKYASTGIDMILSKPLKSEDILRLFKKCNYDYKKFI